MDRITPNGSFWLVLTAVGKFAKKSVCFLLSAVCLSVVSVIRFLLAGSGIIIRIDEGIPFHFSARVHSGFLLEYKSVMEVCQAYQEDLIANEFLHEGPNCAGCRRPIGFHAHRRKIMNPRLSMPLAK
jgi:hypothetical protein